MKFVFRSGTAVAAALGAWLVAAPAQGAELLMVESPGCSYCIEWKRVIGPIYPKTEAGKFAPVTIIDISEEAPFEGGYTQPVVYTPTFVIVDDGQEVGRILGYNGEDFFWPILEKLLEDTTEFRQSGDHIHPQEKTGT